MNKTLERYILNFLLQISPQDQVNLSCRHPMRTLLLHHSPAQHDFHSLNDIDLVYSLKFLLGLVCMSNAHLYLNHHKQLVKALYQMSLNQYSLNLKDA
jgi:hypothetical protein